MSNVRKVRICRHTLKKNFQIAFHAKASSSWCVVWRFACQIWDLYLIKFILCSRWSVSCLYLTDHIQKSFFFLTFTWETFFRFFSLMYIILTGSSRSSTPYPCITSLFHPPRYLTFPHIPVTFLGKKNLSNVHDWGVRHVAQLHTN